MTDRQKDYAKQAERVRILRELHDTAEQSVAGISALLESEGGLRPDPRRRTNRETASPST